jgi:gamma-glutamyltranspeptidase/glutathione hydrolase
MLWRCLHRGARAGRSIRARARRASTPLPCRAATTHVYLCAVDAEGNAVSLIHSLYYGFGSGPGGGGDRARAAERGAGFALDPSHPNAIAPSKRPFHTIIPAMLFRSAGSARAARCGRQARRRRRAKGASPLMAFGVMGGPMQPQGHMQCVANLVDFGMDVQQMLDAPRFRVIEDGGARVMFETEIPAR